MQQLAVMLQCSPEQARQLLAFKGKGKINKRQGQHTARAKAKPKPKAEEEAIKARTHPRLAQP